MAWKVIDRQVAGSKSSGRRSVRGKVLRLSKYLCKGNKNPTVCVYVSEDLMKELRWVVGDRIVPVNDGGLIGLTRSKDGNSLTPAISTKGKSEESQGKTMQAKCQMLMDAKVSGMFVNGKPRVIENPLIDGNVVVIGEPLE